jgi:hypothetical protein
MKARIAGLSAALALIAAVPVYADQPSGRSSVYASARSTSTPHRIEKAQARDGRASVYARDVRTPTPRERVVAVPLKPGRT